MSDDGMTVRPAGATMQPVQPAVQPAVQSHDKPKPAVHDIEAVARQLDNFLKRVSRSLEFHLDNASGQMVCCVRDAATGDLIRQIPNEQVLRMAELAYDETIVLVDERA